MKKLTGILTAVLLLASAAMAQDKDARQARILQLAEQNLKITLAGGNDNLKESAMQAVSDLRAAYPDRDMNATTIPLMKILRTHNETGMRILAALTLKSVGDDRGQFAIYEASRFDDNKTVRHVCTNLK